MNLDEIKEKLGREAVETFVKDGMKIGLGSGSTAIFAVRHLAALVRSGKLKDIKAVSSSFQTTIEWENLGLPLYTLNSIAIGGRLDLTIDGADEVDNENRLIKGGGGALLLEKIIAYSSTSYLIIVDESKIVESLGISFPVSVEVFPFARVPVTMALRKLGAEVELRKAQRKAGPVITDQGNLLLDIRFKEAVAPAAMEAKIKAIPGVIENGFFTYPDDHPLRPEILIGYADGTVKRRK